MLGKWAKFEEKLLFRGVKNRKKSENSSRLQFAPSPLSKFPATPPNVTAFVGYTVYLEGAVNDIKFLGDVQIIANFSQSTSEAPTR